MARTTSSFASVALLVLFAFAGCDSSSSRPARGSLSGTVLGSPTPVSGAMVRIDELDRETRTSDDGFFEFDNLPRGTYTVVVSGTEVFDSEDGELLPPRAELQFLNVGVLRNRDTVLNDRPVFLPELDTGTQLDTGGDNTAMVAAGTVIGNEGLGVFLVFTDPTTVTFRDSSRTTLSISSLPISEVPFAIPDGRVSSDVVVVQPPGTTFNPPVKVVFPNSNQLPPATGGVELYRLDEGEGRWMKFGTGTVDAEGDSVVSDADSGLAESGFTTPVIPLLCTTTVIGRCVDAGAPGTGVAGILCITTNGLSATSDADGNFSISDVPAPRRDFRLLVLAAPLGRHSGFGGAESSLALVQCDGTTDVGSIALPRRVIDRTPPVVDAVGPENGATDVPTTAIIQIELSEKVSPGSINALSFNVSAGDDAIPGIIGVNRDEVSFVPFDPFPTDTRITITLTTAVQDGAGNHLARNFTSSFTTASEADEGAPMVVISPRPDTLDQGGEVDLDAEIRGPSGEDTILGVVVRWSSSDPTVAGVSETGIVSAHMPGVVDITASAGGVSDTLTIMVNAPQVSTLEVLPAFQTLAVGGMTRLEAELRNDAGDLVRGLPLAWSSAPDGIVDVDNLGNVAALAAGMATVTATFDDGGDGISGSARIDVVASADIASVCVTPVAAGIDVGGTQLFRAEAKDAKGRVIPGVGFTWSSGSTPVATIDEALGLASGVSAGTAAITAATSNSVLGEATLNVGLNTHLTVVVKGARRANDPVAGMRILRHHPTTGALLDDLVTGEDGVANFGDTGNERATLTFVRGDEGENELFTFVGIPTGTIEINMGQGSELAQLDVTLTNLDPAADSARLSSGDFERGEERFASAEKGAASFFGFGIRHLQDDGKVSFLALAGNSATGELLGCGHLLDVDPFTAKGLVIDASSPPGMIPFTSDVAVAPEGYTLRRDDSFFDVFSGFGPQPDPATSGSLPFCSVPGADGFNFHFRTFETPQAPALRRELVFRGDPPASLDVDVPDLTLGNPTWDPATRMVSWSAGGTDFAAIDVVSVELETCTVDGDRDWELIAAPAAQGGVVLPELPVDLQSFVPPDEIVSVEVELIGLDIANGFDSLPGLLRDNGGSFEGVQFSADTAVFAEKANVAVTVRVLGSGSGTVVSDPAGIDTAAGQFSAVFPAGTTVTLTAIPNADSSVRELLCPAGGSVVPSESCSFVAGENDDENRKVDVVFDLNT